MLGSIFYTGQVYSITDIQYPSLISKILLQCTLSQYGYNIITLPALVILQCLLPIYCFLFLLLWDNAK